MPTTTTTTRLPSALIRRVDSAARMHERTRAEELRWALNEHCLRSELEWTVLRAKREVIRQAMLEIQKATAVLEHGIEVHPEVKKQVEAEVRKAKKAEEAEVGKAFRSLKTPES